MPRFSEVFGLQKCQAELDFVDIDVDIDIPLYLDPSALTVREDIWSMHCEDQIVFFFQAVISRINRGDKPGATLLLSNLSEPLETHLGVTQQGYKGRGVGARQAEGLYDALANSLAAQTGLLEDLADCALFVDGIGRDKISDITTNIIRGSLISYTKSQCVIHGVPLTRVASGFCWDVANERWLQSYVELPVCNGEKLILVPKFAVRYQACVDHSRYRNMFVLEYLQEEHLQSGTNLVQILRDKKGRERKRVVYKKDVSKITPTDKDFLAQFSLDHRDVLERYKEKLKDASSKVPNINDVDFDEVALAQSLLDHLRAIPPGTPDATNYHNFCTSVISFLFFPDLIYPEKEVEVNEGRKRIDILYTNGKDGGFFYRISTDQFLLAHNIHVECKNYTNDIGNPELDQLIGRFDQNRGRVGLLVFRNSNNYHRLIDRCKDVIVRQRLGLILPIDDDFLMRCLSHVIAGNRRLIDRELNDLHRLIIN